MKFFIVAVCVIAAVSASALDKDAKVLRSDFNQSPEGGYQYTFESDNGISGQASAVLKALGKDEVALEVTGSNSFKSPEGEVYSLTYVANENGYVAQGAHLPTPPPPQEIPEYILRSIAYNAAHPYVEPKH